VTIVIPTAIPMMVLSKM